MIHQNNDPFFSVIVPVYNVEEYIEECILSIINQTEKSFELIIIDDGSTDNSGVKCDFYARAWSQIRVIHKENKGLISARRCGLNQCNGKYVIFVDSDDYLDIYALEKVKSIIESNPVDIVVYRWKLIDEFGNQVADYTPPLFAEGQVRKEDFVKELLSMAKLNSLCLKACKYSLFDVDRSYEEFYDVRNGEDLLQTIPLMLKCNSIYYSQEQIYNYRTNLNGMTHYFNKSYILALTVVAPKLYHAVKSMDLMNKENYAIFFNAYNIILWSLFLQLFHSKYSITEQKKLFHETNQHEFVQKARAYFSNNKVAFPIQVRIGLEYVYTSWIKSKRYFTFLNMIRSILVFIRTVARKSKGVILKKKVSKV